MTHLHIGDTCVHVCRPTEVRVRRVFRCGRCRKRRRHVVTVFEWYGPITICCHCGTYRNDGILSPRKARDWKQAELARALWPTLPRDIDYSFLREAMS